MNKKSIEITATKPVGLESIDVFSVVCRRLGRMYMMILLIFVCEDGRVSRMRDVFKGNILRKHALVLNDI